MNFLSLIEAKREGGALSPAAIQDLLRAFLEGAIPDYQMSAFLMAVLFRGLNSEECRVLTLAMRDSGTILHFPVDARPLVDKHSTGGVGDKVSLVLAPLLACLGFRVPMVSGRALGITGGTLDKLESIPGFRTTLPVERIVRQVQELGCVICGQSEEMVPADHKLYALRDVTGTVPSVPLITASILSKKLAERLDALLLDVKFGQAAFMAGLEQARDLATAMVALGTECGLNTRALLTDMNAPLGRAAGNWLEVREAVDCLDGRGPADLRELVLECAAHLFTQTDRANNLERARSLAAKCLDSGAPRRRWDELLAAQDADLDAFQHKLQSETTAPVVRELTAEHSAYVQTCDARLIGELVRDLGGGRFTQETTVHPDVGIDRLAKPGDAVAPGALLARVHAADDSAAQQALQRLPDAFTFAAAPPPASSLIPEFVS